MNKQQLWSHIVERNPAMKADMVTLKTGSLRKMFDLAWDTSEREAVKFRGDHESKVVNDLMGMFGMRK